MAEEVWEFTAVDTITFLEFHTPMANVLGGRLLDEVKVVSVD